jgi:hypothetical protein
MLFASRNAEAASFLNRSSSSQVIFAILGSRLYIPERAEQWYFRTT